jgi:biopolymer transport protein TolR
MAELATACASGQAQPDTEVQLRADRRALRPRGRGDGQAQKAGLNRIGFVAETPVAPLPPACADGAPAPAA